MSPFSKSAYFRILENTQRSTVHFRPDYPLVVFMLLSRLSFGLGILSGVLQGFSVHFRDLATTTTLISGIILLIAVAASVMHLETPAGFMRMIRNPRSKLTWEIILSGLFFVVLLLNLALLTSGMPAGWMMTVMGWIMAIVASAAVVSTGFAFAFSTHPVWNSKLLPLIYFLSSLTMGLSFITFVAHLLKEPLPFYHPRVIPLAVGILILIQLEVSLEYLRYLRKFLDRALHELTMGISKKLVWAYAGFYFVFPLICASVGLFQEKTSFFVPLMLVISLIIGALFERILFFTLERPTFPFYFTAEKVMNGTRR